MDELQILIQAVIDQAKSLQNITATLEKMGGQVTIPVTAELDVAKSLQKIKSDLQSLEKVHLDLTARLNRTDTRKAIKQDIKSISNQTIKLKAEIDKSTLKQSVKNAEKKSTVIDIDTNVDGADKLDDVADGLDGINRRSAATVASITLLNQALIEMEQAAVRMVQTSADLDEKLTDIRMVTGGSYDDVRKLADDYNALAKEIKATTSQVLEGSTEWLRQGMSPEATTALIEQSMILSKVGAMDAESATKNLTSAMKGYGLAVDDVSGIVDKLTAIDMQAAVSASDLAVAMSRTATGANIAGVSMDRLLGYLATVQEVTQKSAETVGESLKTMFARMNNIKLGVFVDENGEDLNDTEKILKEFGITMRDTNNDFRASSDILDDIYAKWDSFTSMEKSAIATAAAGTRQRENFLVLMENYGKSLEYAEVAANSAGTAVQKFEAYQESLGAKINNFVATFESLSLNTFDPQILGALVDAGAAILSFVDNTNLLQSALIGLSTAGVVKGFMMIASGAKNAYGDILRLSTAFSTLNSTTGANVTADQMKTLLTVTNGLSESQLRLVISSKTLTNAQRMAILTAGGLTKEEAAQTLVTMGLASAEATATTATFSLSGAMAVLTAAIKANPIGFLATALTIAISLIHTVTEAIADAKTAAIDEAHALTEAFEETASELEAMNTEYKTIAARISELQALEAPTLAEQQELSKLQAANNLLEAQIKLKEKVLEQERQAAATAANKALTKDSLYLDGGQIMTDSGVFVPTFGSRDFIDSVQSSKEELFMMQKQYDSLMDEIDKMEAQNNFNADDRAYRNKVTQAENLKERMDALSADVAEDELTLLGLYTSLLDGNGEVYNDYIATADRIKNIIDVEGATKKLDQDAQTIVDSFKKNISNLNIGNAEKVKIANWFDKLSVEDQELAYKISCDSDGAIDSAEAWQSALSTAKEAASKELGAIQQQVKDSSDKSKKLVENFSSVVEVLNAQTTGKSLSFEEYNSEALAEYTEALEYTNGTLQLNSEIVQQIIEQKAEEQISINDTNKALAQSKYLENAREIQKLRDVLKTNSAYREANEQAIRSEIDRLLAENEALAASCTQFDLMTASIREATSAYQHWINSQNAAQSGDMFDGALNAMNHINNTLNNTESEFYGRIGRSDYKAAVDFIVPENVDHDDANAVNSYISSISDMFLYDKSGQQTGLNIANFCQKAVDAGLMVLNEAGDAYEIAGGKTMEDFANGLNLAMPLVQAMFGEMQEFGAVFDWSDEAEKTYGDLAVAANESAEALRGIKGNENLEIRMDVSGLAAGNAQIEALDKTIEEMNGIKAKAGVDASEVEHANNVMRYCLEQKRLLTQPDVMHVDASAVEGELGSAIALLQEFQAISSQIEIDAAMGLDTSAAQGDLAAVTTQIQSIQPDIKAKLNIDTTSIATIQSSVSNLTANMIVKAGVDASAVNGYDPADKNATVTYNLNSRAVDRYSPANHTRTVTYRLNSSAVDNFNPKNLTRYVYYYEKNMGGVNSVNGTAHAGGTARASGDWGTAPGGRTLVGELGREIVVDPHSGRWYTVGDMGAEFVNIPHGAIVFNHLQSDALLKHGYVTTRGMAHAYGTANAGGTAAVTGYIPIGAITSNKYHGTTGGYGSAGSSVSGSTINSSATSSTASSEFEEQYKKYNHLLNMNKMSLADYIKWLDGAYKNAYNRGQIELDDYRQYAEEVYEKLKEQFIDSLDDAEHQIELLSFQTGKEPQIINYYKQMMQSISNEIASAKASGLTETDDYIQELQAKYIAYFEDMADMQEAAEDDAHDAMEDLIEYRIDMLKQDLENEKDALDEKIDSLKEFYNKQKEMLQDARDEEQYIEDQAEKRKAKAEIEAELERLKLDDSAWAQKRRLELQDELADAEKDLTDFEKDHAYDVALDMLDKMYEQQEQSIQSQIEVIEDKLND
ncbi:MAG: phage tail tape measure protein, partial [Oscillospiraceae bacterium]|nr:phage tail tape measure protein [Oscillospiraceae bacterium]